MPAPPVGHELARSPERAGASLWRAGLVPLAIAPWWCDASAAPLPGTPPVCAGLELGGAAAPRALGSSARLEGRTAFPQAQASQVRVCRRDMATGKAVRHRPG